MDWVEKALDKIREWIDRLVDALLGEDTQPEPQTIPIPVRDRPPYR